MSLLHGPGSTRAGFRPDIEGLRAVAVCLVVLNHLIAIPAGGFVGVDLFFVISGFVITSLIWDQSASGTFSLKTFFWRRARRLLPSAVLVLLVVDLVVRFLFIGTRVKQTYSDSLWALALLANVHMADSGTDYFAQRNAPSLLQHYWSLAVEEQYYLVWPFVMLALVWLARKRLGALILPLVITTVLLSLTYAVHLTGTVPARAYFSTPARAWELGVGALVALVLQWGLMPTRRVAQICSWAGLALLVAAATMIDPSRPFPGLAATVPIGAGALLILGGVRATGVTEALSVAALRYLGRISYPIYLWHWPVIVLSQEIWGRTAVTYVAVPFASVLLAIATHRLVEDPLRGRVPVRVAFAELRESLRGRSPQRYRELLDGVMAAATVLILLLVLAMLQQPPSGLPDRGVLAGHSATISTLVSSTSDTPAEGELSRRIAAAARASNWLNLTPRLGDLKSAAAPEWIQSKCLTVDAVNESRCVFGANPARHHAVVMGDSIALSYLPGLRTALEADGWDFRVLTFPECSNAVSVLMNGHTYDACDRHRAWAISEVQRLRPELLVLSNLTNIGGVAAPLVNGSRRETWQIGLQHTLHQVRPYTRRTVILAPPPGTRSLQTCVTRFSHPADCAAVVGKEWDLMREAEEQAAAGLQIPYINTVSWFCDGGYCPAVVGHIPVFWDGVHPTASYSRLLGPVIRSRLLPILGDGSGARPSARESP